GAASKPIMDQMRPLHDGLRQALEGGNPDAATVGQFVIQIHALEEQLKSIHESYQEKLVALLTPEQKEQYEKMKSMGPRGGGPGGPGGPRPFGGPPPGFQHQL